MPVTAATAPVIAHPCAPDMKVIGEAGGCRDASTAMPALPAVLDARLPDGSGIELCRDLRTDMPGLRCVLLTSSPDDYAMLETILAGAAGYVVKNIRDLALATAIRAAAGPASHRTHAATDIAHLLTHLGIQRRTRATVFDTRSPLPRTTP